MHTLKIILFALASVILSPESRAQNIDSLKKELNQADSDSAYIKNLMNLGAAFAQVNFDSAHHYYDKARAQAESKKEYLLLAEALMNKGFVYYASANYSAALRYLLQSARLSEFMGYKSQLAEAYRMIGETTGLVTKENQKAMDYFDKSLDIYKELEDTIGLGNTYNLMGMFSEDTSEAIAFFQLSMKLHEKAHYKPGYADACHNLAGKFQELGQYDSSLAYYYKTLELDEEDGGPYNLSYTWNSIGEVLMLRGRIESALDAINQSLSFSKPGNYKSQMWFSYSTKAKIFEQSQQYDSAYFNQIMAGSIRDSMYNDNTAVTVADMETQYRTEKKELENQALEVQSEQQEQLLEQEQKVIWFLRGGILLAVGLLATILIGYRRKRRMNEQLSSINSQLNQKNEIIETKNEEIVSSISYAKRIQSAILPPDKLIAEYLPNSFVLYLPKDIVAGDFYWMETTEDHILFAAADCTGHGVPGAMVSVICNNGLNRSVREHQLYDPGSILDKTREIVIQEFEKSEEEVKDGMDISLCSLERKSGTLRWAGAYNPLWIVKGQSGELIELKADKQPIGKYRDAKPFKTHQLELSKGDRIYIFSDGFADQFGGERSKKYKSANFKRFLIRLHDQPIKHSKDLLLDELERWKGDHEQVDDICIIGVEF